MQLSRLFIYSLLIIIALTINSIVITASNKIYSNNNSVRVCADSSTAQEYSFDDLGIFLEPFSWEGVGLFQTTLNKTFELNNSGNIIIVFDYTSQGEKPDNPGYTINGTFNDEYFEVSITRAMLSTEENNPIKQISIPLKTEGRIFGNFFNLSITSENTLAEATGSLIIKGSSVLIVGDVLIVDSYGDFSMSLFPQHFEGIASLSGTRVRSYLQFTVTNETLIEEGNIDLNFTIRILGDVTFSIFLFDDKEDAFPVHKSVNSEGSFNASSAIDAGYGLNIFTLEMAIYSDDIWVNDFNITILQSYMEFKPPVAGFGFDNLVIPFYRWPTYPIVGILILVIWMIPYSVLKYREWKKYPDEIEINYLEDDDAFNIFDPEGLDDDDEEFDTSFEGLEEDF